MTKEQATAVKAEITKSYTMTYSKRSETLHIRVATFMDSEKDKMGEWIFKKESERERLIEELTVKFPQYEAKKNNKRYQGFINDICVTVK